MRVVPSPLSYLLPLAFALVGCAGGAEPASGPAPDDAGDPQAILLFGDRSVSAIDSAAYAYSQPAIRDLVAARAREGDVLRVYGLQSNTAAESPRFEVALGKPDLTAAEIDDYAGGGVDLDTEREELQRKFAFDQKLALSRLARLQSAGNATATREWTDVYGALALARNAQQEVGEDVAVVFQSDMVHSTRDKDYAAEPFADDAAARAAAAADAAQLLASSEFAGVTPAGIEVWVFFPATFDEADSQKDRVRAYWESFAEAFGLRAIHFAG